MNTDIDTIDISDLKDILYQPLKLKAEYKNVKIKFSYQNKNNNKQIKNKKK